PVTPFSIECTMAHARCAMRSFSMDLRKRVWAACEAGELGQGEVAEEFAVSVSFITKLLRRARDEGTLTPRRRGGNRGGNRPPALGRRDLAALRRLVRERPDATLVELRGESLRE